MSTENDYQGVGEFCFGVVHILTPQFTCTRVILKTFTRAKTFTVTHVHTLILVKSARKKDPQKCNLTVHAQYHH